MKKPFERLQRGREIIGINLAGSQSLWKFQGVLGGELSNGIQANIGLQGRSHPPADAIFAGEFNPFLRKVVQRLAKPLQRSVWRRAPRARQVSGSSGGV